MQTFAMWSGVAGIIVSLFAVIILFLTRKNILDILDKDVILFDKNFELKKQAISNAFSLLDELKNNSSIKKDEKFIERAKVCYNDLICVVSNLKIVDDFYAITLASGNVSESQIVQFKLACRRDIGLTTKHTKAYKQIKENYPATKNVQTQVEQPTYVQPNLQERPVQPQPRPTQYAQPVQPNQPTPNQQTQPVNAQPAPSQVGQQTQHSNSQQINPTAQRVGRPPLNRTTPPQNE